MLQVWLHNQLLKRTVVLVIYIVRSQVVHSNILLQRGVVEITLSTITLSRAFKYDNIVTEHEWTA